MISSRKNHCQNERSEQNVARINLLTENKETFNIICSFLEFADIAKLMLCSQEMYCLTNKVIRARLIDLRLVAPSSIQVPFLESPHSYKKQSADDVLVKESSLEEAKENHPKKSKRKPRKQSFNERMTEFKALKRQSLNKDTEESVDSFPRKDSEVQEDTQRYNVVYRSLFARETLIMNRNAPEGYKVSRQSLLFGRGIAQSSFGSKFVSFLSHSSQLTFFKTSEYFSDRFRPNKEYIDKCSRGQVRSFSAEGRNLVYLRADGQVHVVFHHESWNSANLFEEVLLISLDYPVRELACSHNYIMLDFGDKDPSELLVYKDFDRHEETRDIQRPQGNVFCLLATDLTEERMNDSLKYVKVNNVPISRRSWCIGAQNAYFVDEKGNLSGCSLNLHADKSPESYFSSARVISQLQEKRIQKVYSGFYYYFAVEREEIESLEHWDNKSVLKWADSIGFHDYIKIMRYEHLTGQDLVKISRKYLADTLGMLREDQQTRFLNEIQSQQKLRFRPQNLYGWGLNKNGQLGTTSTASSPFPIKIDTSFIDSNDEIVDIVCGRTYSLMLSDKGSLWMTKDPLREKEEAIREAPTQKEANNAGKGAKKSERKNSSKLTTAASERWTEITSSFTCLKDGRLYKVIKAATLKDYIFVLGSYEGRVNLKSETIFSDKLRDIEKVFSRVNWDASLNKREFVVGYEDIFSKGILEVPFTSFSKDDIPITRVRYLKKSGVIMWDKVNKITLL
eukprot:TRINITY_DN5608_c0_g1_i4.p1 TRINITY_DN5608_c0_g1~~TRINITY_DN5608_c0_g1_i4.p1  ORF type:complete len:735 (-),score=176.96 TRINITY_DN5608_c0_g1_i4:822-3026(-)